MTLTRSSTILILLLLLYTLDSVFADGTSASSNQTFSGIENGMPITFYQNLYGSPESKVHRNRVYKCSDHSTVSDICQRVSTDRCFCEEHERYAFSFCRKSCGYCSPEDERAYKFWQIKSMEALDKLPTFKDAMFLAGMDKMLPLSTRYLSEGGQPKLWFKKDDSSSQSSAIGFKFNNPVVVSGIYVDFEKLNKHNIFSVESSDSPNGPFKRRWVFRAKEKPANNVHIRADCPILWKRFESYDKTWCFKTFASFRNWEDASQECKDNSANLAFIRNQKENDYIIKNVKPCGKVWIGYNDRQSEGHYKWEGYTKVKKDQFTNWDSTDLESKVQKEVNDCVVLKPNGVWTSEDCSEKNYFICRKEADRIPEVKYDNNNPDIFAPMLFLEEDFSKPFVNNTNTMSKKEQEDFKYNVPPTTGSKKTMSIEPEDAISEDQPETKSKISSIHDKKPEKKVDDQKNMKKTETMTTPKRTGISSTPVNKGTNNKSKTNKRNLKSDKLGSKTKTKKFETPKKIVH